MLIIFGFGVVLVGVGFGLVGEFRKNVRVVRNLGFGGFVLGVRGGGIFGWEMGNFESVYENIGLPDIQKTTKNRWF